MFGLRPKRQPRARSPRASTRSPNIEGALPIPSLDGYTIQELRIEELRA